ncbi:unnamed protein product, partial [marine sediment metagenome]
QFVRWHPHRINMTGEAVSIRFKSPRRTISLSGSGKWKGYRINEKEYINQYETSRHGLPL